jgi:ribosome maturation factor RimP
MYQDIPEPLRALVEPVVHDHGFELVDAEVARGPSGSVVRVVIDTREGDGRVPIDDCAAVSRELETCLDAEGLVSLPYTLEVSSPGLDRVLAREKDFLAACGREVKIETRRPLDGRRRFRGELLSFADGRARVRVDGVPVEIDFAEVAKARQVYEFTSADFAKRDKKAKEARR